MEVANTFSNEELIEKFRVGYQLYHGLTEWRIYETKRTLIAYSAFLEGESPGTGLLDAGPQELSDWAKALTGQGLRPSTVRQYMARVKTFYGWAFDTGLYPAEQLMSMKRVKPPRMEPDYGTPRPYTRKELDQLRADIDAAWPRVERRHWERFRRGTGSYLKVRTEVYRIQLETIIALALHCGLRHAEIFNLSIDAMHPDNDCLVVLRKGGITREVPYPDWVRKQVRLWLDVRALLNPPHDLPWVSAHYRGKRDLWVQPMAPGHYQLILSSLGDGWEMHRLRHTCGTNWLRSGMDIEKVQKLLGHADISQTLNYTKVLNSDVGKAVDRNMKKFLELIGETGEKERISDGVESVLYSTGK